MKHYEVVFEPDGKKVVIHCGATVLEAAGQAGIIVNSPCGGAGTCKKCTVYIGANKEPVLACQTKIESDLTVTIPQSSRFFQQRILQTGIDRDMHLNPSIQKIYIEMPLGDVDELLSELKNKTKSHVHQPCEKTVEVFSKVKDCKEGVSVVLHRIQPCDEHDDSACYKLICAEKGDTTDKLFGIAVDLGTTTIVAKLIDMKTGKVSATKSMANPQIRYGDDVVARISYSEQEGGYADLHDIVIDGLNELTEQLCKSVPVSSEYIYEITAAGNTTMSHILLNFPVEQLGQAPYRAYSTKAEDRRAEDMGLKINPCGNLHVIENIAGFVGSDTTAVAVAVGMDSAEKVTLVVDVGTNGEIILGTKDEMMSASCAAGPALEGARILHGSRAVDGAIERVVVNEEDIGIDVIGGGRPCSICGSGLIDLAAVLSELGIIESNGRFSDKESLKGKLAEAIFNRVGEYDGEPAFIMATAEQTGDKPLYFTQKDVRETQLSKAAIRTGIKLLQKKMSISDEQIDQILLAGAFGNYIRRKSACGIGMLPNIDRSKINYVGNAASTGAQMILLSSHCRSLAGEITKKINYVEIAHETEFQMIFAESLMFGDE